MTEDDQRTGSPSTTDRAKRKYRLRRNHAGRLDLALIDALEKVELLTELIEEDAAC